LITGIGRTKLSPKPPVIQVSLHLPGLTPGFVTLDFLVDTGSTHTCVHPEDAKGRLGISDSMLSSSLLWPSLRGSHGVGGTAMSYVHPAVYGFRHDDGRFQQFHDEVHIAAPTRANERFPSLLGWDILRYFRLELDYIEQRVTLR
jgi:hypothetical protein